MSEFYLRELIREDVKILLLGIKSRGNNYTISQRDLELKTKGNTSLWSDDSHVYSFKIIKEKGPFNKCFTASAIFNGLYEDEKRDLIHPYRIEGEKAKLELSLMEMDARKFDKKL